MIPGRAVQTGEAGLAPPQPAGPTHGAPAASSLSRPCSALSPVLHLPEPLQPLPRAHLGLNMSTCPTGLSSASLQVYVSHFPDMVITYP